MVLRSNHDDLILARCEIFCVLGLGLALVLCARASGAPSVLNFGDSLTLESNNELATILFPDVDLHNVLASAEQSANGLQEISSWLSDPDGNPSTPTPASWDLVRFNHGIHDAVPFTWTGSQVTSATDYINNITSIVSAIRAHSPNAVIVFSTSPLIDPNRATLDPPPFTGLVDYVTYNTALTSYREVLLSTLPDMGVVVDDKYAFYSEYSPSDFPSLPTPDHQNTRAYWHWDGMHFDQSYRAFEAEQTASVILSLLFSPDFDLDGNVDTDDLSIWKANFGRSEPAPFSDGDADRDQDVDGNDFLLWQRSVSDRGTPTEAVPEMSAFWLLALAMITLLPLVYRTVR